MASKWLKNSLFNNKKYLSRKRFYSQAGFTVLLNLSFAFTGFFALRWLCAPVMNCWACPFSVFGCPVGILANLAALNLIAFGAIGVMATFAVLIGRWTCGWICPFGWFQELFYMIPTPKLRIPPFLRYVKYLLLLSMVLVIPWMYGGGTVKPEHLIEFGAEQRIADEEGIEAKEVELKADSFDAFMAEKLFYCTYCPVGTLEASVPTLFSGELLLDRFYKRKLEKFIMMKAEGGDDFDQLTCAKDCFGFKVGMLEIENETESKTLYKVYASESIDTDNPPKAVIDFEYPAMGKTLHLQIFLTEEEMVSDDYSKIVPVKASIGSMKGKFIVLFIFLVSFVFIKRPFCRIACPVGATLGVFSKVSLSRLKVNHDKCIKCDACTRRCPQGLSVYKADFKASECILCNECVHICPTKAISYDNPLNLKGLAKPDGVKCKAGKSAGKVAAKVESKPVDSTGIQTGEPNPVQVEKTDK